VPGEQLVKQLDRLMVELLHGASRLVRWLLGIPQRFHLVPVDVNPYVSVTIQYASAIRK
jgi:hypothetical protein